MNPKAPAMEELFFAAMERDSPEARAAYLDEVCGSDVELRRRVERLLAAQPQVGRFLDAPALGATVSLDMAPIPEEPGAVIGPYKLMEVIGEGGMGVVYVAEQAVPVRRQVALKVIKPGMDTKQVVARFEAERQALALMDHPNIAKVHDAGATESGRPYFVMELVHGIPITEYCDREQLSIRNRLELFVLVCRAVQHAHQKGIIHRDLKPSNILVTVIDGVAVPKVIDFGIAKAIGATLSEQTIYTALHQMVGTPLYMSPEQAGLAGVDVDTRSDIYSLGILLYELITGTTPCDCETFHKAAFDEWRRIIREDVPPKPSTRLSSLGEAITIVSTNRGSEPRKLSHSVRGELDWIVMKALEKDRNRRYETADGLADDLMRFLTNRPVEAGPPSTWYRFVKFTRRNRGILTTAGLVSLALVGGTIASTRLAIRATKAEKVAEGRARENQREALTQQLEQLLLTPHDQGWFAKASDLARRAAELDLEDRTPDTRVRQLAVASLAGLDAVTRHKFDLGARFVAYGPDGQILMGGVSGARDSRNRLGARLWDGASIQQPQDLGVVGEGPVGFRADGTPLQFVVDVESKTLKLRDLASGETILHFEAADLLDHGVDRLPYPAAMTPEGSLVAAAVRLADSRAALIVWDGKTGQPIRQFEIQARCAAFSPDGAFVAIGTTEGQVIIFSLTTGQEVAKLDQGRCRINVVAFGRNPRITPDDLDSQPSLRRWQLATGDNRGVVTVRDLGSDTSRVRSIVRGSPYQVYALAFSPDGALLASAGRYWVRIWDPAIGGNPLLQITASHYVHALSFHPDGRHLVIGGEEAFGVASKVQSLELVDGHGVRTLRGLTGTIESTVFSPDDTLVAAQSHEWQAAVWDRQAGQLKLVVDLPMGEYADNVGLAISPDNRRLAFASHRQARLWDIDTGRVLGSWTLPKGFRDTLVFRGTDQLLLARVDVVDPPIPPGGGADGKAPLQVCSIYNLLGPNPQEPIRQMRDLGQPIRWLALSPDGTTLVVDGIRGSGGTRTIIARDLSSGKELWPVPSRASLAEAGGIGFDPTGRVAILWLGHSPQGSPIVDVPSGRFLDFSGPIGIPGPGALLGIGATDADLEQALYERGRERPLFVVHPRTTPFNLVRFSRDGRFILGKHPGGNAVTVCDLNEVRSRLTEFGVGW